jgi:glycosyltransferase involved in cell wall biosynthesis
VRTVEVLLPNDIDDPSLPSGGNAYDRQVCAGLAALGWQVREHAVAGSWPVPSAGSRAGAAAVLAGLDDGAVVLVDGLIASAVPDLLVPQARRLRLVVLVHMPVRGPAEEAALRAAVAVVTTSEWTRGRLREWYGLGRVVAAVPGVSAAAVAVGTDGGTRLLCVAAVSAHKGHDVLVAALERCADLPWTLACVGSLTRDPGFVSALRAQIAAAGLADRVTLGGARLGGDLAAAYAAADLLVLASRGETYGMVVTEALARGIPVVATAVGGLPESLGHAPDGTVPGILVDAPALAPALRTWLTDPALRRRLRAAARARRAALSGWEATAAAVAAVLADAAA